MSAAIQLHFVQLHAELYVLFCYFHLQVEFLLVAP